MNFIFISPQFPKHYWNFCDRLKKNGVNVLGIGDSPYDALSDELKNALTEYYYLPHLDDYGEMVKAVGFFTFKYGKIDWIESNNEFWLEQDARLRTDFHVTTGEQYDHIDRIKNKSAMKAYYAKAGVPTARLHKVTSFEAGRDFAHMVGYPVIVKPDNGCGAEATYKLRNFTELKEFYAEPHNVRYIMEEYINGTIVSFDGVADSHCVPLFYTSNVFPTPMLDIVSENGDLSYWTQKTVPAALKDVGFRTIKAFGAKSRFFHCEFFQLNEDKPGLGKKGDYVALEVNMRPCGGFTPDMIDFARSTNVYKIWADMIAFGGTDMPVGEHYYCAFAGRRDGKSFVYSHEQLMQKYQDNMRMVDRIPEALSGAMGNQMYVATFSTRDEMEKFYSDVLAVTDATNAKVQAELTKVLALGEPEAAVAEK